ncbi:hypothetical protein ACFOG5_02530 [Pedobacter fastidiosus]|uniref:hypothetical protein n=1 Tax=Pedobacter fastidiosus TaxID=2765361 RepID=UPI00362034B9
MLYYFSLRVSEYDSSFSDSIGGLEKPDSRPKYSVNTVVTQWIYSIPIDVRNHYTSINDFIKEPINLKYYQN